MPHCADVAVRRGAREVADGTPNNRAIGGWRYTLGKRGRPVADAIYLRPELLDGISSSGGFAVCAGWDFRRGAGNWPLRVSRAIRPGANATGEIA